MKNKKLLLLSLIMVILLSLSFYACNSSETGPVTYGEWELVNLPTDTKEGAIKRLGSDGSYDTFILPVLSSDKYVKNEVDATCEEDGEITYIILTTNKNFLFTIKTNKLGHNWNDPTYTWSEDNSKCTVTRVCSRDENHKEIEEGTVTSVVTSLPTFDNDGETKYTATFKSDWADTQIKVVSNNNKYTLTKISGKKATCTENGLKEYYEGSNGKNYTDETRTTEIKDLDSWRLIPAFGHDWGEPSYYFNMDCTACQAVRTCKNDPSHKQSELVDTVRTVGVPATCTNKGKSKYTATFESEWATTQFTLLEDILKEPSAHDYNDPTYTWAADYSSVKATRICKLNNEHIEEATSNGVTISVNKMPTLTEKGKVKYQATFSTGDEWAETNAYVIREDLPIITDSNYTFIETLLDPTVDAVGKAKYKYTILNQEIEVTSEVEKLSKLSIYINGTLSNDYIGYVKDIGIENNTDIENILKKDNDGYLSYKIYSDANITSEVLDINEYTKNKTAATIYIAKSYTLSYSSLGGTAVQNTIIQYNDTYSSVETTRDGYVLDGWYSQKGDGDLITFGTTKVNPSNHTIYANWIVNGLEISGDTINKYTGTEGNLILPSVYKGNKVTRIKPSAIINNLNITKIEISKYINNIHFSNFSGCTNLIELVVNSENTKYWSNGNCIISDGTEIEDESDPTTGGVALIKGCKSTVIPPEVEVINFNAFDGVNGIDTIFIPETVTKIRNRAFKDMEQLKYITIPKSITGLGGDLFVGCGNLTDLTVLCTGEVMDRFSPFASISSLINVSIPASITSNMEALFPKNYQTIQKVTINSGTRTVELMFANMLNVLEINLPNTLEIMGAGAFYFCKKLQYMVIPSSVTTLEAPTDTNIRAYAQLFEQVGYINIVIPTSIKHYYSNLVGYKYQYNILVKPNSPDEKWDEKSLHLENCNYPLYQYAEEKPLTQDVEKDRAGYWHFDENGKPVLWNFATQGIQYKFNTDLLECSIIGFDNSCTDKNLVIPHYCDMYKVTTIRSSVFQGNQYIQSIDFGNNINTIEAYAFKNCTSLLNVNLPNNVTVYDGVFEGCTNLIDVKINCNIDIRTNLFKDCTKLKNAELLFDTNGGKLLNTNAFSGCISLETITISNITDINLACFNGLTKLTTITYNGTIEEWNALSLIGSIDPSIPVKKITCTNGDVIL